MRKKLVVIAAIVGVGAYFFVSISQNLQTERNDVSVSITDADVSPTLLSIAVLGDVHLPEGPDPLSLFRALLQEVKAAEPDLIVFVGDYTSKPGKTRDMPNHRENVINALKLVDPVPRAVVLGNYESWSDADRWLAEFTRLGVDAMENEIRILETSKGPVCIRGLGDAYTNRYRYVDYPAGCQNLPKLTITHDPVGAFDKRLTGLVIAGHTHCGQVSLPFVGPLWVPSAAPSIAHCGVYQDSIRTVFVTSGVGTSILPLRFGAQSQWDFVEVAVN